MEEMQGKATDPLYAGALTFKELRGNQAVFAGENLKADGARWEWGKDQDGPRPIEDSEFIIDRRYWMLLGSPDQIVVGFSTEAGFHDKTNRSSSVPE